MGSGADAHQAEQVDIRQNSHHRYQLQENQKNCAQEVQCSFVIEPQEEGH